MNGKGWRGYISSKEMGGSFVPQRVQNLVIRDYAARHGLLFLLSAVEYDMDDCVMMLRTVMAAAADLDGIIFYSTHLLPRDDGFRKSVYRSFLEAGGALRFALEELLVTDEGGIAMMEELIMCRRLSSGAPPAMAWEGL